MLRTALVLSSLIVSGITVLATAKLDNRRAGSAQVAPLPTQLPPPPSVKSLFQSPGIKPLPPVKATGLPRIVSHEPTSRPGESWLTCGMTIFKADPAVDRGMILHGSGDGHAIRRIEPKICK